MWMNTSSPKMRTKRNAQYWKTDACFFADSWLSMQNTSSFFGQWFTTSTTVVLWTLNTDTHLSRQFASMEKKEIHVMWGWRDTAQTSRFVVSLKEFLGSVPINHWILCDRKLHWYPPFVSLRIILLESTLLTFKKLLRHKIVGRI